MNMIKIITKSILVTMLIMAFGGCSKTVEPTEIMSENEIALKGYDPVSYFTLSKAEVGELSYFYSYKGMTWQFVSAENLELFRSNPDAYIPVYGGFCAYALSDGDFVPSDPEFWYIHDEKLYLFEDEDAKKEWFREIDTMIIKADEAWKLLLTPLSEEPETEEFEEIGDSFINAGETEEEK